MIMRSNVFAILFSLTLSACASAPTSQELSAANYGTYPSDYEVIIKSYLMSTLKDPSSAQYNGFTQPRSYWIGGGLTPRMYGYMVCVTLNAKNSYGAYVGFQTDLFLIRDGTVIQYVPKADNFLGRNMCTA